MDLTFARFEVLTAMKLKLGSSALWRHVVMR